MENHMKLKGSKTINKKFLKLSYLFIKTKAFMRKLKERYESDLFLQKRWQWNEHLMIRFKKSVYLDYLKEKTKRDI